MEPLHLLWQEEARLALVLLAVALPVLVRLALPVAVLLLRGPRVLLARPVGVRPARPALRSPLGLVKRPVARSVPVVLILVMVLRDRPLVGLMERPPVMAGQALRALMVLAVVVRLRVGLLPVARSRLGLAAPGIARPLAVRRGLPRLVADPLVVRGPRALLLAGLRVPRPGAALLGVVPPAVVPAVRPDLGWALVHRPALSQRGLAAPVKVVPLAVVQLLRGLPRTPVATPVDRLGGRTEIRRSG